MEEIFEGGCQCGETTYRVAGQSLALFACHCTECQRQSSSAFGMALWIRTSKVELLSGRLQSWSRTTPSGRQIVGQFCPTCGSRIFHQTIGNEGVLSIKPGTLNDTTWLRPVAHIWTESAQPWVRLDDDCLVYPNNPPGFDAVMAAWRRAIEASGS